MTTSSSNHLIAFIAAITLLLLVGAFLYFSDTGQDIFQWMAQKYFVAEAKATEKALEKAGSEKAEGFL